MALRRDDGSPNPSERTTIAWMEQDLAHQWSLAHHRDRGRAWIAWWGSLMGITAWAFWAALTIALMLAPFPFNLGGLLLLCGAVVFLWPALLTRSD
ncbi:MAG: hypothetical protein QOI86_5038 [Actinomycetota bacterium]|nr:hypothetical protein [Actinomycetota bacterium]